MLSLFTKVRRSLQLAAIGLLAAATSSGLAATLPSGFTETNMGSGIGLLTAMAVLKDGRILVTQQDGYVRVLKGGKILPTPFVTIDVVKDGGDSGLFGVVADPNFANNGYIYVFYTTNNPTLHNRVSRFTANPNNPDVALAGSEVSLIELDDLVGTGFHSGGAMRFAADGTLFVTVGDNDDGKYANSQNMNSQKGKILRINRDGTIPTDNPFYNTASGNNRAIWALGLRNPFTMDIQPGTGRIFVCDVGNSKWEELNEIVKGGNYGWPYCEGACVPANSSYKQPLHYYAHGSGNDVGCCIIGATFYNPPVNRFPSFYTGKFFFADYCNGWVKTYDPATGQTAPFATGTLNPAAFEVGSDGYLYYLPRAGYGVYRISYTGQLSPAITEQPASQTKGVDQSVTFHVSASGDLPLSYQWQRNGSDLAGETSDTYTIVSTTVNDNGAQFRCVVTNSYGSATSQAATLTVTNNQPPAPTIASPVEGAHYNAGDTIDYVGTASDSEDGEPPASAYTWWADFEHHGDDSSAHHGHPFFAPISGVKSGSFTIPTTGETDPDVWYRLYLKVTDSGGVSQTVYRDILPNTSTFTLASNPPGLQLALDGQAATASTSTVGVVGIERSIGVYSPQTVNGTTYVFDSWSDGGAAGHIISTPSVDSTYTATFHVAQPAGIASQPASTAAVVGSTATFQVTASGDGPFSYQWQRQGVNISGATSATYVTPPVQASDNNTNFRCIVTNSSGASATSNSALLSVMVALRQYTSPPGLKMLIDNGGANPGVPVTTPWAFNSVIGTGHSYSAVTPQTVNGVTYDFDSWSMETASSRNPDLQDVTPATNRYYTAVYKTRSGVVGTGTGLLGKYSDNADFTGAFVKRTDAVINFNWRQGAPMPGISSDTFSARWTGYILAPHSQQYTFYTSSDDGVRLFVDGKNLIDDWNMHAEEERTSKTIWLTAGKKYPIRLDYFDSTGGAAVRLYWSGRSTPKALVPASQLYPN